MANAVILEFQGVDEGMYNAVNAKLGLDPAKGTGGWPAELMSHIGGATDDGGWIVAEVWESQAAHAAWMESRLGQALGEVGVPAPTRVTWVDIAARYLA